ncbi:unnamed protein product [Phytophthora fragariaefolia]|uniref:Unnamed protein product n=1 Tax=Phytophthora fragariaefolia TaxID=1490495 RepID=A0A9W7CU79_9STRA|nr:unnamed protein product [Phytophthora fragariaefolia]
MSAINCYDCCAPPLPQSHPDEEGPTTLLRLLRDRPADVWTTWIPMDLDYPLDLGVPITSKCSRDDDGGGLALRTATMIRIQVLKVYRGYTVCVTQGYCAHEVTVWNSQMCVTHIKYHYLVKPDISTGFKKIT